jgi:hypothetical protein
MNDVQHVIILIQDRHTVDRVVPHPTKYILQSNAFCGLVDRGLIRISSDRQPYEFYL